MKSQKIIRFFPKNLNAFFLAISVLILVIDNDTFIKLFKKSYQDFFRGQFVSLFTAVAAFIFSLKTFIIVNMFDKVYSTEKYKMDFVDKYNNIDDLYKPLENFGNYLLLTIYTCIIAALVHLCFGFILNVWFLKFAFILTLIPIIMILYCVYTYNKNMQFWYKSIKDGWSKEKNEYKAKKDKQIKEKADNLLDKK
ncbi:MAG: hypothetical protein NE327_23230 [Lentisphaeraceae bacterium]|nr:hypothetical protein [Lentisphaeraceae bacterium]